MTIHFDAATDFARALALRLDADDIRVVVVRDIAGRLTLVVDDRTSSIGHARTTEIAEQLRSGAGGFAAAAPLMLASKLLEPEAVFDDPDVRPFSPTTQSGFLDRQIVGTEWARVRENPNHQRVTFYGYKGGVGRSTATFMLAKHLASNGYNVLVVDLDLESPGVGPLFHADDDAPEFGLVDHLIESVAGATDDLDLVARSSRVVPRRNGEVWVAPARGRPRAGYTYLPKLNRIYADLPILGTSGISRFADRLDEAIGACEAEVARRSRPVDAVLLDSRAGVHDIAAASITQLSDLSFLFATDNQQTWTGYSELFEQWRASGSAGLIRERLRMVASLTPPRTSADYLAKFSDRSQECFARFLYDDADGDDPSAYNPSPDDATAPHHPVPILFSSELLGLDQGETPDWHESDLVKAAYDRFLVTATELVMGAD